MLCLCLCQLTEALRTQKHLTLQSDFGLFKDKFLLKVPFIIINVSPLPRPNHEWITILSPLDKVFFVVVVVFIVYAQEYLTLEISIGKMLALALLISWIWSLIVISTLQRILFLYQLVYPSIKKIFFAFSKI